MAQDHILVQTQEIEALQAIYGEDYESRPGVWNRPAFAIRVRPVGREEEVPANITLIVKFSLNYPRTVPTLDLADRKGISEKDGVELLEALTKKAAELVGEVMVYELVLTAEDFLIQRARKTGKSFYEEMQQREKKERRKREEAERAEAEAARAEEEKKVAEAMKHRELYDQSIAEEIARRRERLNNQRVIGLKRLGGEEEEMVEGNSEEGSSEEEDDEAVIDVLRGGSGTASRYEADFKELGILGRGGSGQVVKVRNRLDKRLYAIKKILLDPKDRDINRRLRREVTTISRMYHKNIVRYYQAWVETGIEEEDEEESIITSTIVTAAEEPPQSRDGPGGVGGGAASSKKPQSIPSIPGSIEEESESSPSSSSSSEEEDSSSIDEGEETDDEQDDDGADSASSGREGVWNRRRRRVSKAKKAAEGGGSGSSSSRRKRSLWASEKDQGPLVVFGSGNADDEGEEEDDSEDGGQGGAKGNGRRRGKAGEDEDQSSGGLMELLNPIPRGPGSELSWSFSAGYTRLSTPGLNEDGGEEGGAKGGAGRGASAAQIGGRNKLDSGPLTTRIKSARKHLYIQMEYCEQTLRGLIDTGKLCQNLPECWRLLRQILEALVYIHKKGIIHRDLKPPNIFLDGEGNVKVGDFGLATVRASSSRGRSNLTPVNGGGSAIAGLKGEEHSGLDSGPIGGGGGKGTSSSPRKPNGVDTEEAVVGMDGGGAAGGSGSITGGVGTTFYIAPEQEAASARYDQKADMFSLGIVLFEMAHAPFGTMMERARALTTLRNQQALPPDFVASVPALIQKVILQLVASDPSQRPSAAELLESGELPGKLEVEEVYLKEALGTLTNPQSLSYGRLVKALFEHSNPPEIDATYDLDWIAQNKALSARDIVGRESVCDHVRNVFQLHGALPLSAPMFRPRPVPRAEGVNGGSEYGNHHPTQNGGSGLSAAGPDYLDTDGAVLRLPTDLLVPFARYVARTEVTHMKRFEVSKIYKKQEAGGHPKEELSAQLDMIYDARHTAGGEILEAEVIWAAGQVVKGALGVPYLLRLNSVPLTLGTLELLDVPAEARRAVVIVLEAVCSGTVTQIKTVGQMVDGINGLSKTAREGVRGLVTRLWGAVRDPLSALQAIEDALSALPQVKAVLNPPVGGIVEVPGSPTSRGGGEQHHHHHHHHHHKPLQYSRRELKRICQACKSVSDALHSLRTLLHYLHALGMLPPSTFSAHRTNQASSSSTAPSSTRSTTVGDRDGGPEVSPPASLGLSPKEPSKLMEASLRGAKGLGPLEVNHAPSRVVLDVGLYRRKSHYNSGLIFQMVVLPRMEESAIGESDRVHSGGSTGGAGGGGGGLSALLRGGYGAGGAAGGGGGEDLAVTTTTSKHQHYGHQPTTSSSGGGIARQVRYQRFCVVEGGRYDGLILEHRSPAQWASPLVIAAGLTVAIEKLITMAMQLHSPGMAPPEFSLSLDVGSRRGPPDALICSTGSGLGPGGMTDRLLVASYLWARGIKADYLAQDLWGGRAMGVVEISIEEATRICLALGIPFLVMIKAHTLREKQAVKLRSIRDVNVPDSSVLLVHLARTVLERLPHLTSFASSHHGGSGHYYHRGGTGGIGGHGRGDSMLLVPPLSLHSPGDTSGSRGAVVHNHTPAQHHHPFFAAHHQASGGGVEITLNCLDRSSSASDRRKAYKEVAALERRVRSHLEATVGNPFQGGGHKEAVKVLAVDVPYMVIRVFCTAYLQTGSNEEALKEVMGGGGGQYKRSLKLLAEALEAAEREEEGGGKGGGTVVVYSVIEDCFDVVPLMMMGTWVSGGSSGGGGGKKGMSGRGGRR